MKFILILLCVSLITNSCKKNGNNCWEAVEAGTLAPVVFNPPLCAITKKAAEERYPNFWFYPAGTATNCYKVVSGSNTTYMTNMAEEVMQKLVQAYPFYQVTKVSCGSFCNVVWTEKHKGKITGQYGPIYEIHETLFSPDSCNKLTIGRVIIINETVDSLITREVKEKKP